MWSNIYLIILNGEFPLILTMSYATVIRGKIPIMQEI